MAVVAEDKDAKAKRLQELHDIDLRSQKVEIGTNIAYTIKNCLSLGQTEEGESWRDSGKPKAQFTEEQAKMLKDKLYNILMGL